MLARASCLRNFYRPRWNHRALQEMSATNIYELKRAPNDTPEYAPRRKLSQLWRNVARVKCDLEGTQKILLREQLPLTGAEADNFVRS